MQGERAFGHTEEDRPAQKGLSTEDIARPPQETARRPAEGTDGTGTTDGTDSANATRTTDATDGERGGSSQRQDSVPLLEAKQAEDLRFQWKEIQQGFVDDPQSSVRAADGLVAEVMQLLAKTFADHKHGLESQWHAGEDVATEDLRLALQQYRSFFDRLLSA